MLPDLPLQACHGHPQRRVQLQRIDVQDIMQNMMQKSTSSPLVSDPVEDEVRAGSSASSLHSHRDRQQPTGHYSGTRSVLYTPRRDGLSAANRRHLQRVLVSSPSLLEEVGSNLEVQVRHPGARVADSISVREVGTLPAARMMEVRIPAGYMTDPKVTGLFPVASDDGPYHVHFESSQERRHMIDVQRRESVAAIAAQPMVCTWSHASMVVQHVPDILFELRDGRRLLIDVHKGPLDRDAAFGLKVRLTAASARRLGWEYEVLDFLPAQLALNQEYLANFSEPRASVVSVAAELSREIEDGATIARLIATGVLTGPQRRAGFWYLLHRSVVQVDLTRPIRTHSIVRHDPLPGWTARPWVLWPESDS